MGKRIIALLLLCVMVAALCACGSETAPASAAPQQSASSSTQAAADPNGPAATNRVIATNNFFKGAYPLDIVVTSIKTVTDICGDTILESNDEGNIEKIVADIENFVAAGADGILWLGFAETNFQVGPQKANAAGVPIAFVDKYPLDKDLLEQCRSLEYFAGGIGNSDYTGGANMAEYALSLGCKKALIEGAEVGDTAHDPRIAGFTDVFTAGGGEVLAVAHVDAAADKTTVADNLISAYPDADCFFGSGGDQALAGMSVSATLGRDDIKVLGVDISPDLLPYLKDGSLAAGCGAHWVNGMFTAILLENYLDGCPMIDDDGKVAMLATTPLIVIPAPMADLYNRFWIEEFPYEESEIKQMLYRYNPDVTIQDIKDMLAKYSVEERLIAKYEAGKVTAEELAAVGINVG